MLTLELMLAVSALLLGGRWCWFSCRAVRRWPGTGRRGVCVCVCVCVGGGVEVMRAFRCPCVLLFNLLLFFSRSICLSECGDVQCHPEQSELTPNELSPAR